MNLHHYRNILIVSILTFCLSAFSQNTLVGSFAFDGIQRSYRLRLPANHDKNIAIPLVFNFHGFGSNAIQQELYSNMNFVADTARFGVCYPDGIGSAWNVGWAFGSTANDVGFISALIDDLILKYGFNPQRVYSCGMSNGGFMSYKLACELNNKIAAIASVTGSMTPGSLTSCKPGKAFPVLEIHGTADGTVDYNGTPDVSTSIANVLAFWQNNNGCDKNPVISMVPNINTSDNTTSEIWQYVNCDDNKEVLHYKVFNGGHTWPGAVFDIGTTSKDFRASEVIWKFFSKYSLPNTSSTENQLVSNINLFPNPFIDQLTIDTKDQNSSYEMYDLNGQILMKGNLTEINNVLNTGFLNSGMYYLKVNSWKEGKIYKIIKL